MAFPRDLTGVPDGGRAPLHPALKRVARSLGLRRAPAGHRGVALRRHGEDVDGAPAGAAALAGSDGWLFLTGDSNDVLGQHTGAVRPGRAWRQRWSRLLARRTDVVRRLGAEWVYLVAPDKESVYAEKLPQDMDLVDRRPVHDFLEVARERDAPVLYSLAELEAAKSSGLVYFQTNTHWTALGCHVAYRRICDELARRGAELPVLAEDEIEWAETTGHGDLGSKLEPKVAGRGVGARVLKPRARLVSDNRVWGTGRVCTYESDRARAPNGVICGTCFASAALCFFKSRFATEGPLVEE